MATKTSTATTSKKTVLGAAAREKKTILGSAPDVKAILDQFELPSPQRVVISLISSLFVTGASIYVGIGVSTVLATAAMAFTASAFLTFMIFFIGYMLALIGGVLLGSKVQEYILTAKLDADVHRAKDWLDVKTKALGSWFDQRKAAF